MIIVFYTMCICSLVIHPGCFSAFWLHHHCDSTGSLHDGLMHSLHVSYVLISVSSVIFNPMNTDETLHLKLSTQPSDDSCSNRAGVVLNSHTHPPLHGAIYELCYSDTTCFEWTLFSQSTSNANQIPFQRFTFSLFALLTIMVPKGCFQWCHVRTNFGSPKNLSVNSSQC